MITDINIKLVSETDEQNRAYFRTEYEVEHLKDLAVALLTDDNMKEVATMAVACILSQEDDPEALIEHIRSYAEELRNENRSGSAQKDEQTS